MSTILDEIIKLHRDSGQPLTERWVDGVRRMDEAKQLAILESSKDFCANVRGGLARVDSHTASSVARMDAADPDDEEEDDEEDDDDADEEREDWFTGPGSEAHAAACMKRHDSQLWRTPGRATKPAEAATTRAIGDADDTDEGAAKRALAARSANEWRTPSKSRKEH